ncbi:hypothetical protein [Paractinoplanes aksuensis]|uniref:hypothetical protein n=1 Tax=Paractinoplanes aksuensis TaxID=2939490 RepID=UPI003F6915D3
MTVDIARKIAAVEPADGTRIVGIDGPSGSGKSHLARELAEVLSAPIIEIDDFVYTEHWLRREGYAARQFWRRP